MTSSVTSTRSQTDEAMRMSMDTESLKVVINPKL